MPYLGAAVNFTYEKNFTTADKYTEIFKHSPQHQKMPQNLSR